MLRYRWGTARSVQLWAAAEELTGISYL